MANYILLSSVLLAPNGRNQSFLEGIFNPAVSYDQLTNGILGRLSNDDTNSMRRTNSAMNNYLMALKDDGTFRHSQEVMLDKCDVRGLDYDEPQFAAQRGDILSPCPNEFNSSARIRRCTRGDNEPGYRKDKASCHRGINNFLVCTTCGQNLRNHPMIRRKISACVQSRWGACAVCTETQERKYPNGAQLCTCIPEIKRQWLCYECMLAKLDFLVWEANFYYVYNRRKIRRDDDGQVKFDRPEPRKTPGCLGCGVRPFDCRADDLHRTDLTKICFKCRKYAVVPSQHPPAASMGHGTSSGLRRSARLNPLETPVAHIRLSHRGTALRPMTEPQGPHGLSIVTPRKRKSPG